MSVVQCCIDNCENEAIVHCSCSDQIFLCHSHIPGHISAVQMHNLSSLVCSLDDEFKPKVLKYLELEMQILQNKMINLFSYTKSIIDFIIMESKKVQKSLKIQIKTLTSVIKQINHNPNINRLIIDNIYRNINPENKIINFKSKDLNKAINKIKSISLKKSIIRKDNYAIIFNQSTDNRLLLLSLKSLVKGTVELPGNDFFSN